MDSSVAAWLMREQGYRCEGTTMRLYRNADIGLSQFHTCCSQKDIDDASVQLSTIWKYHKFLNFFHLKCLNMILL